MRGHLRVRAYNDNMAHPDVLIVGGGVIGLTCGYFLAKEGLAVEVLDRGPLAAEASWAGAGIIPPGNPDGVRSPYDRLRAISSQMFQPLSAELADRTGIDNGYRVCGGVEFPQSVDATDVAGWEEEGITFEVLSAARLRALEPALADGSGPAFYFPGMAQVRNPRHLRALTSACRSLGVGVAEHTPVIGWELTGERVTAARLPDGVRRPAGQFLIAAGAWSDQLLSPLGLVAGVRPVRGQIVLLKAPAPPFRPILLHGKNYLVPRDDGRVLVGSTEEPEAGFVKQTTAEAVAGLIRLAIGLVPALARADVERAWAGLRPGSQDALPCLGPVPRFGNAFVAAGHFRAGIQLSTGTGLLLTQCLTGKALAIPLDTFRPDREPNLGFAPVFRS